MDLHPVETGLRRIRSCALTALYIMSLAAILVTTSCATARKKRVSAPGPFTRAVLLFYEFDKLNPDPDSVQSSDALSWLTLERGKPKTITLLAFDQDDRWMQLSRRPSIWTWKSSDNVEVQRTNDGPTARVTMTSGNTGWLQVSAMNYGGDIKVLREGYRQR